MLSVVADCFQNNSIIGVFEKFRKTVVGKNHVVLVLHLLQYCTLSLVVEKELSGEADDDVNSTKVGYVRTE